jgi:L-lactate dehydrogenase (cytochrome)
MALVNIYDLREAARRRLPRMMFGYVDGASYSERTAAANIADFNRWNFVQRVLVDIAARDLSTTIMGQPSKLPFMLGPTGFAGLLARRGEVQAARAADAAGIPFALSNAAICGVDEVSAASRRPIWYQLYCMRDAGVNRAIMDRAAAAKCPVLVLTVDASLLAKRERDVRNNFITSPKLSAAQFLDFALHPRWAVDVGLGPKPMFGNLKDLPGAGDDIFAQANFVGGQLDLSLTWKDAAAIRAYWKGKLVIKGIMSVADAREAVAVGADGIVVTNHGGRQLDGAVSSIRMLPAIAAAVGDRVEVLFDGGIRRGQHIATALALGAHACLIGRAFLYGLGARGQAGVALAIEMLRAELDTTLGLMGVTAIDQIRGQADKLLVRAD